MTKEPTKPIEKRLPETYYEYQLALAGEDYLNPQRNGQIELAEGEIWVNPPTPNSGWVVWVEVKAINKTRKFYLHIENTRFGIKPCVMTVNNWKKIEANFISTFIEREQGFNRSPADRELVEAALKLLLIFAKPKNISDYSSRKIKPMVDLGMQFCFDLFQLAKDKVEHSEWVDWSMFWRSKYFALLKETGRG